MFSVHDVNIAFNIAIMLLGGAFTVFILSTCYVYHGKASCVSGIRNMFSLLPQEIFAELIEMCIECFVFLTSSLVHCNLYNSFPLQTVAAS